jgi:hypothetical protein
MKQKTLILFYIVISLLLCACKQTNLPVASSTTIIKSSETEVTTTEAATTAETTTTEAVKEEVKLEWGMSAEQIKSAEAYELSAEDTADINGIEYTLLIYKDVPFKEHNTQMTVYLDADDSLGRISYMTVCGDSDEAFFFWEDSLQSLREEYGEEDITSGNFDVWHSFDKNVTIMLAQFGNNVIESYLPLYDENERKTLLDHIMAGGKLDENGSFLDSLIDNSQTEQEEYSADGIVCEPIDQSLDCEKILLVKADEIQKLFKDFLWLGGGDAFEFGDWESVPGFPSYLSAKEAKSNEIKTIADIKNRMNESIYDKYTDYLMQQQYGEADGKLYRLEGARGNWLGVNETWYIGYDVTDDKIIGHFAVLGWGDDDDYGVKNPDHLNDINSYEFYDITVQNVGGKYVVTDVRGTTNGDGTPIPYDYFECHGCYYNCDVADRSLITNEAVKPKN